MTKQDKTQKNDLNKGDTGSEKTDNLLHHTTEPTKSQLAHDLDEGSLEGLDKPVILSADKMQAADRIADRIFNDHLFDFKAQIKIILNDSFPIEKKLLAPVEEKKTINTHFLSTNINAIGKTIKGMHSSIAIKNRLTNLHKYREQIAYILYFLQQTKERFTQSQDTHKKEQIFEHIYLPVFQRLGDTVKCEATLLTKIRQYEFMNMKKEFKKTNNKYIDKNYSHLLNLTQKLEKTKEATTKNIQEMQNNIPKIFIDFDTTINKHTKELQDSLIKLHETRKRMDEFRDALLKKELKNSRNSD